MSKYSSGARLVLCGLLFQAFHFYRRTGKRRLIAPFLATILALGSWSVAHAQAPMQVAHNNLRPEVASGNARLAGTMPEDARLNFSIVLPLRNEAELNQLLDRLYDPSSPDYRQFLSVEEFTGKFGPAAEDYAAVVAFARASGFKVTAQPANRLVVPLSGTVEAINKAFHVRMSLYQHPTENRTFYSPDREPALALSVPVAHLAGLNNYSLPKPMVMRASDGQAAADVTGSGPGGAYLASDMRAAYYGGTQLTGDGQAVGLVEFAGYYLSDVNETFTTAGQSYSVPINNVLLDDALAEPAEGEDDAEPVLDIVQAIGMAPGLSQVRVYIGNGSDDANVLNSMATENIAKVLSCSWEWLPDDPGTDDVIFKEFAAQGQTFFVASGDEGAFDPLLDPFFYPAEDQNVTSVGGTHLTTVSAGGAWQAETAWNTPPAGSGGGVSQDGIPLPSWQSGLANAANGASATLRNEPDVAMEADFDNYLCDLGKCTGNFAGTSFAAPRWAGFVALVNQQAVEAGTAPKGGVGFLNPSLYAIGAGSNAVHDFHDIVSGNNRTDFQPIWYNAVTGYDLVTGWGTPAGADLINDLAGKQMPGFWLSPSSPTVAINPGASGSTTISIVDAGGFSGKVQLAVTSTLPTGVTAKWGTNPTSGSSVLTLTAAGTVPNTTTTVTVTGTSGSITETAQITLIVHTPSFSLSTMPGSVGVTPGNSVNATVVVTPLYGFTGSVKLAVTGLPAGVTATLGTNPTTGTSQLTLAASSSAVAGTSNLTITGTSGNVTATTTLVLEIHVPAFTLYNTGNVNLGAGTSGWTTILVNDEWGFSGDVTLSVSGLPKGVTASFPFNPASTYSQLTLAANSTTALGTSTITVTGTSGKLTAKTTFKLNVLPPTFVVTAPNSLNIGRGTTTTSTVWVVPEYGFTGNVTLVITGLPSGVTATLAPNPTDGMSTLTLTAGSSAALGTSAVTITGTSGSLKATATISLGVFVPTFSLSNNGPLSLGQGSSVSSTIIVTPLYGFTGSVNLAVSGLPGGVSASISPNPSTGDAQLTLTASNSAPVGSSTVTITGVSGAQTAKTTLALGVFVPGFSLTGPGPLTLGVGASDSSSVTVTPLYGFMGSVSLSAKGLPSGVTASFSPNPTTGNSNMTLAASSAAKPGNYTLTLKGASGTNTVSTTFPLTVAAQGFTLSSSGQVSLGQGTSTTASVIVNPLNGFTGSVQLAVSGLPSGVTASFNPALVTGTSVLTLAASASAAAGSSTITVTGTSGTLTATAIIPLQVAAPTFTLSQPATVTMSPGQTTTTYIEVNPAFGFTGSVKLSASGLPAGVTASISPNPSNQNAALTLTASSTAAAGTSTVTIKGTWKSQTCLTTFPLVIAAPTFSLSAPPQMQLAPGSSTTATVSVGGSPGFVGSVKLAVSGLPSGVTAAFSPNPASGLSTLTLTAASSAPVGISTLTVTGTLGKTTATTAIQLQVAPPAFTLSTNSSVNLTQAGTVTNVVYVNSEFGFTGPVTFAVKGLPSGVTATWSPNPTPGNTTLTLTASSSAALANKIVTITGTSGSLKASTTFQLIVTPPVFTISDSTNVTIGQGTTTTTYVYVYWQNGFSDDVNLSIAGLPKGVTASFSPVSTSFSSVLTLTASTTASLGQYNAILAGTYGKQTVSALFNITVAAPGFALWGNQSMQIGRGTSATGSVNVTPQNGFSGSVHLAAAGLPSGVTASFSPNPTTGSSTMTLTASSTASLGEYNAAIVGTWANQTASMPLSVSVYQPSFTVGAFPPPNVAPGSSGQATVNIQSLYGFTGSVNLSVSGLPSGVTASFLPNPSTNQSLMTVVAAKSASPGQYNLTITGTSGKQTAAALLPLTIDIPGFTLWSSGVSLGQGQTVTTFVSLYSTNGLLPAVQLTASGMPKGVTASFSPNPTTSSSTLTLTATNSSDTGEYAVTISGAAGKQLSTTQIPVTIGSPSFTLSSIGPMAIGPGSTSTGNVWVFPQFGFKGAVTFAATGLPSGVTASFSSSPATGSTAFTLTASSTVALGQYNVSVVGTSGALSASSSFVLYVGIPAFRLGNEGYLTLGQGATTSDWVSIQTTFGFNSPVTLSISGLPTGVTGSFSPNPATTYSTLSLAASASAATGASLVTITGSSGKMTATTQFLLTIATPGFSLSSYQNPQLGPGTSTGVYIDINPTNGFNGSVQLAASGLPSGMNASFSPNPANYLSTMTVAASSTVAPGQYNITVIGTCGSQKASIKMPVQVEAPDFTISSWGSVNIGRGTSTQTGVSVNPEWGFNGSVQLGASGLPNGVTASFSPNPATGQANLILTASKTATLGQYSATVTGTSGNQSASATLTLAVYTPAFTIAGPYSLVIGQGTSTQSSVYVNPLYGFAGNVQFAVSGLPSGVTATFSPNPATSSSTMTLTASNTASLGEYTVTVTGTSGSQSASTTFPVSIYVPTFTISEWGNVNIGQGTSTTASFSINPEYGFTGLVQLAISGLPKGITASFSPNPATTGSTLYLTASSTAPLGQYNITVTGTSGSQSASTTFVLGVYVPTFTLTDYYVPALSPGASVQTWIYITDEYGFSGSVQFSVSGLPSGVTASFSPNPATNSSDLSLTAGSSVAEGEYTLTVTGASGSQKVTTSIQLSIN